MKISRRFSTSLCLVTLLSALTAFRPSQGNKEATRLFEADDRRIQYTGRIDFSNPKLPRFWAPGVYIQAKFKGTTCDIVVNDEVLWGKSHNYLEVVVDTGKPFRVQTTGTTNTIRVADGIPEGTHTLTICKDTEAGIGYLEFVGLRCQSLLSPPSRPKHKLEFIGDSITCGAESDLSVVTCGQGQWYDRHNAYLSYGPMTARLLNAQWQLSSVSGIGLMHSCCNMKVTMPDVWNEMSLQAQGKLWDFHRYQPDAVMICLGQNDGIQEEKAFSDRYVEFIKTIRQDYPKAQIVCLTSPMAGASLRQAMQEYLPRVVARCNAAGDKKVHTFFFSRGFNRGCGGHPDLADHEQIAKELSLYLQTTLDRG